MPPQTRSRGVPAPSRVYNSTPNQQQVHFPPRRRVVRTYGKQTRKTDKVVPARSLRQQTLTQIDFVSSFEEPEPTILSDTESGSDNDDDNDSDDDDGVPVDENKENKDNEEDDEPVSSGRKRRAGGSTRALARSDAAKRRRTLGDDDDDDEHGHQRGKGGKKEGRRKTLGDLPTSSSSYHTQTLTQFLGRDPANALYVKDSEDEDDDENGNQDENDDAPGFQDWLGDPTSPSPLRNKRQATGSPATARRLRFASPVDKGKQVVAESPSAEREESIVPQTPAKRRRDDDTVPASTSTLSSIASPERIPTPVLHMMDRYGPPDKVGTPVKKKKSSPSAAAGSGPRSILKPLTGKPRRSSTTPRAAAARKEVVIQDSFASGSWDNVKPSPLRSHHSTPGSANKGGLGEVVETSSVTEEMDETPTKPRRPRGESAELGKTASPTPRKRLLFSPRNKGKRAVLEEIPDSDEEEEGEGDFDVFDENQDDQDDGEFVAGPETQLVMSEIASTAEEEEGDGSVKSKTRTTTPTPVPAPSSNPTTLPPRSSSPLRAGARLNHGRRRVRQPLNHNTSHSTSLQTQPLESQRVAASILRSLPEAGYRTDVLLPLDEPDLASVVEGYRTDLSLPFKIPASVVRFWLFDGQVLRHMACAEAGRIDGSGPGRWRYVLTQVYELNNPIPDENMREEDWFSGPVGRYAYLPPAIVNQLMWNFRHAVFADEEEEDNGAPEMDDENNEEVDDDDEGRVQLVPSSSRPLDKKPTPTPSMSVSQQVEAQLRSDIAQSTISHPPSDDIILVPSTPEAEQPRRAGPPPPLLSTSSTPTRRRSPLSKSTTAASTVKRTSSHLTPPLPNLSFTPSSHRASRLPPVRPSQATTASQASTPEKPSSSSHHHHHQRSTRARRPSHPLLHSSSSILFVDESPLQLPPDLLFAATTTTTTTSTSASAAAAAVAAGVDDSQLLTKSQTLPDSLLRDDARLPPEIWDSEDDEDTRL